MVVVPRALLEHPGALRRVLSMQEVEVVDGPEVDRLMLYAFYRRTMAQQLPSVMEPRYLGPEDPLRHRPTRRRSTGRYGGCP